VVFLRVVVIFMCMDDVRVVHLWTISVFGGGWTEEEEEGFCHNPSARGDESGFLLRNWMIVMISNGSSCSGVLLMLSCSF
jgi:hypothetical protein